MPHPLTDRLDGLRRRLRRAGVARGAALCVVAVVFGAAVAALADAAVRSDEAAWRLLMTAVAVVPATWAAVRSLWPPLRDRPGDVDLARRVEERDPSWNGRLSAAAAFLKSEAASGSPALRERVVEEATGRLAGRPLPDLAEAGRVRRPICWAGVTAAAGVAMIASFPSASATALSRLALPLSAIEWPRKVDLLLLAESGDPLPRSMRIGRGQTLRFTVRNRHGDVPEDLTLELLPPNGGRRGEPVPTAEEPADDGEVRLVGTASLFAAEGPLRFRVTGGDDRDMPFVTAEVVPPPVFDRIEVTVTPPAYLGLGPAALPKGVGHVAGVVGSSVVVTARASKPLSAAELRIGDAGAGPPASIGPDRRTVTVTFPLSTPGVSSYWFRLRDEAGFENPESTRYELRVTADAVPELTLSEPPEDLRATAEADLPVIVEASDDHGLAWVRLRFARGNPRFEGESAAGGDETQAIPLFDGPGRPAEGSYPLVWSLGPLGLVPGDRLSFRGEAGDAFDLGPPHLGFSSPRTVSIVSAVEKREEVLDRQTELLEGLRAARRDEERLGAAVDSLLTDLKAAKEFGGEDHDRLARAEAEQRRLSSALVEPERGLEARAARAVVELRANRIDDEALAGRLERIVKELSLLREESLPAMDRDLTEARKAGTAGGDAGAALAAARGHLDVVLGGLDSLLADLGAWQSRRDLGGEVTDLLSVQRELAEETEKAASETLGAAVGQLTDRQTADLERLGSRQAGLADRLARLGVTIERQAAGEPSERDDAEPRAGKAALGEAAELMRGTGLPAAARAAGDSIRGNELGEAGRLQSEVLASLGKLREVLTRSESPAGDAETLQGEGERVARLAAAEQEIAETLRKIVESSEAVPEGTREALTREQSRLREEAIGSARRLHDVGAGRAERELREASRSMADALERLSRHKDEEAARDAEAAAERLDRARQEVERAAGQFAERLARELVESSAGTVAALAERQRAMNDEVERLDRLRNEAGRLSRSQLRTLRQTAETQRAVAAETAVLAGRFDGAAAVALALRSAADRMTLAAGLLDDDETGEEPQRHGQAAKEMLDRIEAALKPRPPAPGDGPESEPAAGDEQPPGEAIPLFVQLELLKGLQEDLLRRTEEIDMARSTGVLTAGQEDELLRIGQGQTALADLFLRLVGRAGEAEVPEQ